MEFHVLLIVLAITLTSVSARPKDTVSRKIRASESGGLTMKLPIPLQEGWIINITGTLDLSSDMLDIVFPTKIHKDDYYRFIYDFKANIFYLHANKNTEKQEYRLVSKGEDLPDYPTFNLDIKGGPENFTVFLNLNKAEELETTIVNVETFEDFERIEFKTGLDSITSIQMKMQY